MYKYKVMPDNPCYYSDTDSVFLEKPLDDKYISSELGKLKLEYIAEKAIFLGPKNYYVKKQNGEEISKIKGYSDNINFNEWRNLLVKDFKLSIPRY